MRRFFIFVFLTIIVSESYCQNKTDLFNQFVNKFKTFSFPVTNETFEKYDLHANNPCNITKHEFDFFIKTDDDKFWKYIMYSPKQPNYFNYVAGLKFLLNENTGLIALIYFREYSTEEYTSSKEEDILSVYDKYGNMISQLAIGGGYGDSLTFSSKIYSPEKIEIYYTKYLKESEEKYSKYYYISNDGKIIKM